MLAVAQILCSRDRTLNLDRLIGLNHARIRAHAIPNMLELVRLIRCCAPLTAWGLWF
jgi:hypothetical protein